MTYEDELDESPNRKYNLHVLEWRTLSVNYEAAVIEAAETEGKHKLAWAKAIIKIRNDPANAKTQVDVLKALADTDPDVEAAYMPRVIAEAKVEGLKKRLEWAKAYADNLRTQVVNEREENRLASQAGAGPGASTFEPTYQRPQAPPPTPPAPQDAAGWAVPPGAETPQNHPFRGADTREGCQVCGAPFAAAIHSKPRDLKTPDELAEESRRHFEAAEGPSPAAGATPGDVPEPGPPDTSGFDPEASQTPTGPQSGGRIY